MTVPTALYHGNFGQQLLSPVDGNILQADAIFISAARKV